MRLSFTLCTQGLLASMAGARFLQEVHVLPAIDA